MGLDTNMTKFMLYAKTFGVDYNKTAMIGRQAIHLHRAELRKTLSLFNFRLDDSQIELMFPENTCYAEKLINYLGAKKVDSFDNSDYEDATHIHDMNYEIPTEFHDQYSVVLDSGTLEHIFNFPIAIKNCMEMVKVGGHYLSMLPTNNEMGHGFYQFSPELFFSIFTKENGFELLDVIILEIGSPNWYRVSNPKSSLSGERALLRNSKSTHLLVLAKKIKQCEIFKNSPQQSDYVYTWDQDQASTKAKKVDKFTKTIGNLMPERLKYFLKHTSLFAIILNFRSYIKEKPLNLSQSCYTKIDPFK